MSFLVVGDEASYVNATDVSLQEKIPLGFYKVDFNKFRGTFLSKTEFKLEHGKIYGTSQVKADHIVQAFKLNEDNRNLGVLLSGGRGLGKTLTTRLIIEQLYKEYPILTVSEYTPDLPEFLSHVKGCVILMDEFEKFMGGQANGSDNDNDQSKQESMLSVLDGNTGSSGNLYLLTVNNTYKLDENLKSRPGRIRYHYKYDSEKADVVRGYCTDNLKRPELTEEVVRTLGSAKYVSLDIITAFVDELNKFPTLSPKDIKDYFNIEASDRSLVITIVAKWKEDGQIYTFERSGAEDDFYSEWFGLSKSLKSEKSKEYRDWFKNNEDADDDSCPIKYPTQIYATIEEEDIPTYIYGVDNIDPTNIEVMTWCDNDSEYHEDFSDEFEVLEIKVKDKDFSSYSKKYGMAY